MSGVMYISSFTLCRPRPGLKLFGPQVAHEPLKQPYRRWSRHALATALLSSRTRMLRNGNMVEQWRRSCNCPNKADNEEQYYQISLTTVTGYASEGTPETSISPVKLMGSSSHPHPLFLQLAAFLSASRAGTRASHTCSNVFRPVYPSRLIRPRQSCWPIFQKPPLSTLHLS